MNNELVLQRFALLPENLQAQALDYIEFLIQRYTELEDVDEVEEISPELKALLEERIAEYEKNPQNVVTLEEIEDKFNKKYGYAL